MSTFNKKVRSILTQKRGIDPDLVDDAIQVAASEEKSLIDRIVRAELPEAVKLMEEGKIEFLIEGKPALKHYRIMKP